MAKQIIEGVGILAGMFGAIHLWTPEHRGYLQRQIGIIGRSAHWAIYQVRHLAGVRFMLGLVGLEA